jgi:hypothetical protein
LTYRNGISNNNEYATGKTKNTLKDTSSFDPSDSLKWLHSRGLAIVKRDTKKINKSLSLLWVGWNARQAYQAGMVHYGWSWSLK